jgi:Flp pilus assembly protein TadD
MKKITIPLIIVLILAGCQRPSLSENQRKKIDARQHIIQSLEGINNKDFKSAILNLKEAIKSDPSERESYFLLGQVFLRVGQPADAAQVFELAAHLLPEDGTIFYMLAIADSGAGRRTEALGAARRSVEIFSQKSGEAKVFKNSLIMAQILWSDLAQGYRLEVINSSSSQGGSFNRSPSEILVPVHDLDEDLQAGF